MNILIDFIVFVMRSVNISENLAIITPLVNSAAIIAIFVSGIFCKKIKTLNKTAVLTSIIAQYTLLFSKLVFDAINSPYPLRVIEKLIAGSVLCAVSFLFATALIVQSLPSTKNAIDKRVNDYLDDTPEPSKIPAAFMNIPFRREEKLSVDKMFENTDADSSEPNYSEILSFVEKIRKVCRDRLVNDELDKIQLDVERYRGRKITDFERQDLSRKLSRLVKLFSKYAV